MINSKTGGISIYIQQSPWQNGQIQYALDSHVCVTLNMLTDKVCNNNSDNKKRNDCVCHWSINQFCWFSLTRWPNRIWLMSLSPGSKRGKHRCNYSAAALLISHIQSTIWGCRLDNYFIYLSRSLVSLAEGISSWCRLI